MKIHAIALIVLFIAANGLFAGPRGSEGATEKTPCPVNDGPYVKVAEVYHQHLCNDAVKAAGQSKAPFFYGKIARSELKKKSPKTKLPLRYLKNTKELNAFFDKLIEAQNKKKKSQVYTSAALALKYAQPDVAQLSSAFKVIRMTIVAGPKELKGDTLDIYVSRTKIPNVMGYVEVTK